MFNLETELKKYQSPNPTTDASETKEPVKWEPVRFSSPPRADRQNHFNRKDDTRNDWDMRLSKTVKWIDRTKEAKGLLEFDDCKGGDNQDELSFDAKSNVTLETYFDETLG